MLEQQQVLNRMLSSNSRANPDGMRTVIKSAKKGLVGLVDLVYEYALVLLGSTKQDVEQPIYLEQLCQSALELHDIKTAEAGLSKLKGHFGITLPLAKIKARVIQLKSSQGQQTEPADSYLQNVIKNDLSDPDAKKMYISCKYSQNLEEYVQHLDLFLKSYPLDIEAWQEVGVIYTTTGNFAKAAFCYQELLMLNPSNTHYYVRVAELLYTQGGSTNLRNAKDYLCFVAAKDKYNYRALWCLNRTCKALISDKSVNLGTIKQLLETTQALLTSLYKKRVGAKSITLDKFKF